MTPPPEIDEMDSYTAITSELASSYFKKDGSTLPTELEDDSSIGDTLATVYNDVTDESQLVNKPLKRKPMAYTLWTFQIVQATLMITSLFILWSKTRLVDQTNQEVISTIDETTIWSNIDMYRNGDCWDIVILIYIFCVCFPLFRILLFTVTILMQTLYFDHEKWPISTESKAQAIADEGNEKKLMPWWHVNAWKEGFRTKEGNMKLASISLDMLTICNKMAFTQYVLICLLAWCLAVEYEKELDNGETAYIEINIKCFFGVGAYELSYSLTSVMVGLLVWQQVCWLRSYKERAVTGLNAYEYIPKPSENESDAFEGLGQPLLQNGSSVNVHQKPTRIDYLHAFLWVVGFINWLILTAGISVAQVDYSGQWMEGLTKDHKIDSYYDVIYKAYKADDMSAPGYRESLMIDPIYNGFGYPTIALFLMGYLVLGKVYRKAYDEAKYIKAFRMLRAVYPMSPLEPNVLGYVLFIIEIERITDPLLNEDDECQEEKCLTIKGKYVNGLLSMILFMAALLWLYISLRKHYGHMVYKI